MVLQLKIFRLHILYLFWGNDSKHFRECCTKTKKVEIFWLQPSCTKGGNRTRTILLSLDFESSASTNSATLAFGGANIHNSLFFQTNRQKFGKIISNYQKRGLKNHLCENITYHLVITKHAPSDKRNTVQNLVNQRRQGKYSHSQYQIHCHRW